MHGSEDRPRDVGIRLSRRRKRSKAQQQWDRDDASRRRLLRWFMRLPLDNSSRSTLGHRWGMNTYGFLRLLWRGLYETVVPVSGFSSKRPEKLAHRVRHAAV